MESAGPGVIRYDAGVDATTGQRDGDGHGAAGKGSSDYEQMTRRLVTLPDVH
jgi:hypothetical protein